MTWVVVLIALWLGSLWAAYDIGYLHGDAAGVRWARQEIFHR